MAEQDLTARPFLEEQVDRYDALLKEFRAAIEAEFPDGTWTVDGEPSSAVADSEVPEGRIGRSPIWVYDRSIAQTEEDKQKAIDAITPIAKEYGFIAPIRYVDSEGRVQVVSEDKLGATFNLGSATQTTLDYRTGVHRSKEIQ